MKRAVVVVVALASLSANAQSLKQLLDAAEQNNLDRKISIEQRQRAATEFRQAWSALLPSVTAQGSWTHNQYPVEVPLGPPGTDPVVITPEDQLDGIVRFEVPLIDTTRWFRISAAGAMDDAAEHRERVISDGIKRQVAATYYSYAAALALRESARRSVSVAEAQLNLQQIRERAGAATELDLLRAQAEVQRTRQTVADTEALVATTRRGLRTLTGIEVTDTIPLPADNLQLEGPLDELEQRSDEAPAVLAAQHEAVAADRLATASTFVLVPSLAANFTQRFTNATAFAGEATSYTYGVGLVWRLDVPTVFNMSVQRSNAAIANFAVGRQRLLSRDQIHTDWQRLKAAIEKVTAAETQVKAAARAAQVARDRYAAGAATQIDVIQSERDLFNAEVNHIQARTELASSHISLRLSASLPLNVE